MQLVQGCIRGDVVCQKQLYQLYARTMMGVCLRYAKSREEAEDFLQDGFIKMFKNIDQYEGKGSLEGWVRRIMVNTALASMRKFNPLQQSGDVLDLENSNGEEPEIISSLSAKDLLEIIHRIPDGYRIVFSLYAIEGYSHKEIAAKLGITESTSKSQLSRARATLQKMVINQKLSMHHA
ncbi:MAG: sigma-70 family RNA polymerase sigma factor [Flavobacteriales bacterium]|nr:sigma-70 family RNA polymerase sigma factor [Flavobacteriales bacterium]